MDSGYYLIQKLFPCNWKDKKAGIVMLKLLASLRLRPRTVRNENWVEVDVCGE